jgi:hypothetical protein
MEPSEDETRRRRPGSGACDSSGGAVAGGAGDARLGPHAAAILAAEHWSLLASRSLIWNEAMSRATVFLTTPARPTLTQGPRPPGLSPCAEAAGPPGCCASAPCQASALARRGGSKATSTDTGAWSQGRLTRPRDASAHQGSQAITA